MSANKTLLIMAGGTGGHIFPGLAVAKEMQARGWRVVWMGNPNAMEGKLVPEHGLPLEPLVFSGLRGKGRLALITMPFRLIKALIQAVGVIVRVKPSAVLGMGGYVAFPGGVVARLMNKPLVVHEQNSVAGMTNRYLAKMANRVLEAFPNALPNAQWTGNPVRQEIGVGPTPSERFAGRQGPLKVLVVGGSLGAHALNTVVPEAIKLIPVNIRPEVTHQAGLAHIDSLKTTYASNGVQANCVGFIQDMASELRQADVVICRSGAMTVAEVSAVGAAALFIPYPFAVDDHQTGNARFLVQHQAAWMKPQKELTPQWLSSWLQSIERQRLCDAATKALGLAKPNSSELVANVIEEVTQR